MIERLIVSAHFRGIPIVKLNFRPTATLFTILACASAAHAGEEPLYEEAPEWVEVISIDEADRKEPNDLILSDQQIRIEEGQRWDYFDRVFRIPTAANLSKAGTQKFLWLPDKGDLIIHEISILRADKVINVLEAGGEVEVLRRERMLERGILDGSLTATIAVPGLAVDDQLRIRYSVTNSDQALGKDVQSGVRLWRDSPATRFSMMMARFGLQANQEADFSRVMMSWPESLEVRYKAGPDFDIAAPQTRDGYRWLKVEMPLPELDRLPHDAPWRFRVPTQLQAGTFADWAAVSTRMAPLYKVDGAVREIPGLAARADQIAALETDDLKKAIDALEMVQEDIRYLMNGLDGGNYIPQSVATTWAKKYGDCKAKTVLLLALLDHLGIEAEAVLVSTNSGDAVSESLPIPGAFNHVLVRATIDGEEYFLDGTARGANIKTIANVPPFKYYLPIQDAGATLKPIEQSLPRIPESEAHVIADGSAGVDLPTIGTVKLVTYGARAVQMNATKDKLMEAFRKDGAPGFGRRFNVVDVSFEDTDDDSEAIVSVTGIMPPFFKYDGARGEFSPGHSSWKVKFAPNRARQKWREIPVDLGNLSSSLTNMRVSLPFDTKGLEISGSLNLQAEAAGKIMTRKTQLVGNELLLTQQITNKGGELAPDAILDERRKAQRLAGDKLTIVAPKDAERAWRFAGQADRSELAPLEDMMAKAIANDPDEAEPYVARARFRSQTYDFDGALEDLSAAITLDARAGYYNSRARVHSNLRDWSAARADYEEAYAFDPTPERAISLARVMGFLGDAAEARTLLELESGDEKTQQSLAFALADLDAMLGEAGRGLQRLEVQLDDDPNNARIFNQICWFIGVWQIELSEGEDACRLAVERGDNAAQALDSRAMYRLRVGQVDAARVDIEEALNLAPHKSASLLLRGLIKREQNDATAEEDIQAAIARQPALVDSYSRWGFAI